MSQCDADGIGGRDDDNQSPSVKRVISIFMSLRPTADASSHSSSSSSSVWSSTRRISNALNRALRAGDKSSPHRPHSQTPTPAARAARNGQLEQTGHVHVVRAHAALVNDMHAAHAVFILCVFFSSSSRCKSMPKDCPLRVVLLLLRGPLAGLGRLLCRRNNGNRYSAAPPSSRKLVQN